MYEETTAPAATATVAPEAPEPELPPSPAADPVVPATAPEEKKPAVPTLPGGLGQYDKRYSKPEKRHEEKQVRFSDRHLAEKSGKADRGHRHTAEAAPNDKPAVTERPHRDQLPGPSNGKASPKVQEQEHAVPQEQQPILTSQAFDVRLKKQQKKKQVFRKAAPAPAKAGKEAEHKPAENVKQATETNSTPVQKPPVGTVPPPKKFQYPSQYTSQKRQPPPAKAAPAKAAEAAAETPAERPPLRKRLPYYIGIALCSVVLIVSGTMLVKYYSQIWRANHASSQLRDLYQEDAAPTAAAVTAQPQPAESGEEIGEMIEEVIPEPTEPVIAAAPANTDEAFLNAWPKKYPSNEQLKIQERFTPLRHQNRDIVGWLTIEGVVDEPVFQRDNNFYLTHDATGAKNPTGALFLDEKCNLRSVPMMTLVHGHNMKEGAMFGSLKKYKVKDASYYKEHPFVTFDTLYEKATYVIFAVAEVNIVPGNTHYFPFWHQFSFGTKESFEHFVLLAKEYSRFKVDIDVAPGDRLLTLATCSSDDSNLRLIVMARMLRENEDKIMLSNKIYSATAK